MAEPDSAFARFFLCEPDTCRFLVFSFVLRAMVVASCRDDSELFIENHCRVLAESYRNYLLQNKDVSLEKMRRSCANVENSCLHQHLNDLGRRVTPELVRKIKKSTFEKLPKGFLSNFFKELHDCFED